jgi:regulator of sigma E protease
VAWILTLLGIVMLIVLHELGHFSMAKAVGMRVERFSLFFPPALVKRKWGETEYAIGAIPAGGYVKITGMTWEEIKDMDLRLAHRAYCVQPPWKRIAVILAGPGVNILIAFLLFWLVLFSGDLHGAVTLENLDPSQQTFTSTTRVQLIEKHEPAEGKLLPGDRIVAADGQKATVATTMARIDSHRCAGTLTAGCRASTPVKLTVDRRGHDLVLSIYPRYNKEANRMLVGFAFHSVPKTYTVLGAAGAVFSEMWHVTTGTVGGFGKALTSSKTRHEVSSIIGITQDAHQTVQAGAGYALVFLGFISLVLAVINLFPFLPLDGGHVLWSLAEKVRGRRVSLMAMYRFSSVGIVLLLFLVVNGVSNDISRLTG